MLLSHFLNLQDFTALLFFPGVRASETLAATDLRDVNNYKSLINTAADDLCVEASVIAGLHFSRNKLAGLSLAGLIIWEYLTTAVMIRLKTTSSHRQRW